MHISYKPLWRTLLEQGMSKEDLRRKANLTTNAIANMGKDQNVSLSTIVKVCEALNCNISSVIEIKDFERIYIKNSSNEMNLSVVKEKD